MSKRAPTYPQGMPFSFVASIDTDPAQWMAGVQMRADLLRDMRPDLSADVVAAMLRAITSAGLCLKATEQGKAAAAAAMAARAVNAAWLVEGALGFVPRVRKANAAKEQRDAASKNAAAERKDETDAHKTLALDLLPQVSARIVAQGASAIARDVKKLAAARKPATPASERLAALGDRQVKNLLGI